MQTTSSSDQSNTEIRWEPKDGHCETVIASEPRQSRNRRFRVRVFYRPGMAKARLPPLVRGLRQGACSKDDSVPQGLRDAVLPTKAGRRSHGMGLEPLLRRGGLVL